MKWIHSEKRTWWIFRTCQQYPSDHKIHTRSIVNQMSFLDATTTITEGIMTTDLYSKPTHKQQFLLPSSCHPQHCFKSIPFSQAIRVKRIWSIAETTKQTLRDLRHHLKRRGYNDKVIESGFSKASEINRNDLLEYKEKHINNVNHVVTSVESDISNCNTHTCSIARRQERSTIYFAMSIAKHLMWFTSLTVTSAGRNT